LRKQCARAILASVQANTVTTPPKVAEQLLRLWVSCLNDARPVYALLEELDVGLTDLTLLHALAQSPTEPTVKELSERMCLSLPGASRAADALLRRGWVERREDEHDRRMKRLTITDDGREVLRAVDEARMAGLEQVVAGLPAEDLDRLSAAIEPILTRLEGPSS
jgi:DNA-binding MarR family transcriptional regulator